MRLTCCVLLSVIAVGVTACNKQSDTGGAVTAPASLAPPDSDASTSDSRDFRNDIARALEGVDVSTCKTPDAPRGRGHVRLTVQEDGRVTDAIADAPPFAGTPVGACIAQRYAQVKIASFANNPVWLRHPERTKGQLRVGKDFVLN
jgi:hypothetical protein